MELNICELDDCELDDCELDDDYELNNNDNGYKLDDSILIQTNKKYEEIEEVLLNENEDKKMSLKNNVSTKVTKTVHFNDDLYNKKPMHQSIPSVNAKMVRPKTPMNQPPKISYEDILSKMGMFVSNGKLHLVDKNSFEKQKEMIDLKKGNQQQLNQQQLTNDSTQNSYIYNKFFKDKIQPQNEVRIPRTLQEYKMMLVEEHLKRERLRQIKSTRLIMPTSNINISEAYSPDSQNKLFTLLRR